VTAPPTGDEEAGTEEPGDEEPGDEEAGIEEPGTEEPGTEEALPVGASTGDDVGGINSGSSELSPTPTVVMGNSQTEQSTSQDASWKRTRK